MGEQKKNNVGALQGASFLSLGLMGMGMTVVTPALATFAAHWPGANVSFIQTLCTLGCVIGSLVAGMIMGKVIKIKTLAILSSAFCLIFGFAPAFFDNYVGTLICRTVFGFALGLLTPLGNALIMQFYTGKKQASMLGYGTMAMSLGGILFQTLGGVFAAKAWNITFYAHVLFAISLVMSFFIPKEPELTAEEKEAMKNAPSEKMSNKIWVPAIVMFLFNMVNMPMMMNASMLFEVRDAGGAVAAANALNGYTIAGIIAGLVFGKVFGALKSKTIPVSFAICAVGAIVVYFGQTALIMGLGMALIGFGFNTITPAFMALVGMVTPPSTVGKGTSVLIAAMNLGGFISSFWLILLASIFGESLMSTLITEIVIVLIIAVVFVFYNPYKGHMD